MELKAIQQIITRPPIEFYDLASALSRNIPFVRIDLYSVGGKIYFGEFTFYPNCGVDSNILHDADVALGSKINLSIAYKGVGK